MSEVSEESDNKGFYINTKGISCIPCRCKRQFYHKETTTVKENNITTTNTVVIKEILNLVVVAVATPAQTIFLNQILICRKEALKYVAQDGVNLRLLPKN